MATKYDPLRGMNPDQSGPIEKIQNGDPKSNPQSDQRSGAAEAGGPGPSKQEPFGEPAIPSTEGLEVSDRERPRPPGVSGEPEEAGALDRAGHASYQKGVLKDATDQNGGDQKIDDSGKAHAKKAT